MITPTNPSGLQVAVERSRQKFRSYLDLSKRTRLALFQALSEAYGILWQIHTNPALKAEFDRLLSVRGKRQRENPILFLVKYIFFPKLLEYGSGSKPVNNQASRYATLLKRAWDKRVPPPRFVHEARQIGIQKGATRSSSTGPKLRKKRFSGRSALRHQDPPTDTGPTATISLELAPTVVDFWRKSLLDSEWEQQTILLKVTIDRAHCVVTAINREVVGEIRNPASGPSPESRPLPTRTGPPLGMYASTSAASVPLRDLGKRMPVHGSRSFPHPSIQPTPQDQSLRRGSIDNNLKRDQATENPKTGSMRDDEKGTDD